VGELLVAKSIVAPVQGDQEAPKTP
jgi:hypothetical protein